MDKKEFWLSIKHCFLIGKNTVEAKQWLDKRYRDSAPGISTISTMLHESLGMRKLFSKWVPRLLTPNQKQQRVEDSERFLELFNRGKKDFLRRYVTMNETWIHH